MLKIKLFAIAAFLVFASSAFLFSSGNTQAQTNKLADKRDEILGTVADYKSWKQVQKPEKKSEPKESMPGTAGLTTDVLSISQSSLAGWSSVSFSSLGNYSGSSTAGGTTKIGMASDRIAPLENKPQKNPHEKGSQTFARYFANELANAEIYKPTPKFAVGSIIVREKLLNADDAMPELVTVMVKREKGFSPKTGDWEYLVVEGGLDKIRQREKTGSCSKCHANAEGTDFVFKTYLK